MEHCLTPHDGGFQCRPAAHRCMSACACMARMRCRSDCSARTARPDARRPWSPSAGRQLGATTCAWRRSPTRRASISCCRSARWKGYGGDTDFQGATLETITWATGLLAATEAHHRLRHRARAAVPPADRGEADGHRRPRRPRPLRPQYRRAAGTRASSRCSASTQSDHAARYAQGQEWIDVMRSRGRGTTSTSTARSST